jgi:hypothetical protein
VTSAEERTHRELASSVKRLDCIHTITNAVEDLVEALLFTHFPGSM